MRVMISKGDLSSLLEDMRNGYTETNRMCCRNVIDEVFTLVTRIKPRPNQLDIYDQPYTRDLLDLIYADAMFSLCSLDAALDDVLEQYIDSEDEDFNVVIPKIEKEIRRVSHAKKALLKGLHEKEKCEFFPEEEEELCECCHADSESHHLGRNRQIASKLQ